MLDLLRLTIRVIPEEACSLQYLRKLEAQSNLIDKLPPQISRLARLAVLDLSLNDLTTLPPEIGAYSRHIHAPLLENIPCYAKETVCSVCAMFIFLTSTP